MAGLLSKIKDHFTTAEFTVAPNKKVKSIQADFKKTFGLTIFFYKGKKIAEGDLTLAALASKTTKEVKKSSDMELKLKAAMSVGKVESLFDNSFGLTTQIKDPSGKKLVPDQMTLGDAARSYSGK